MATRSRTSFQKRQKEIARAEKQRDKMAKRAQRKLAGPRPPDDDEAGPETGDAIATADDGSPADTAAEGSPADAAPEGPPAGTEKTQQG